MKIIHSDLEPSNILISDDFSKVKIADFGLSIISSFSSNQSLKEKYRRNLSLHGTWTNREKYVITLIFIIRNRIIWIMFIWKTLAVKRSWNNKKILIRNPMLKIWKYSRFFQRNNQRCLFHDQSKDLCYWCKRIKELIWNKINRNSENPQK